jgi:hypothetical protein
MTRETVELFRGILGLAGGSNHASHAGHMPAASPPPATTPAQAEEADGTPPQECGESSAEIPESSDESMGPLPLVFVGWNPAELLPDRPANLDRVVCNVKEIGRVLSAGLDELLVWRPTMAEIQKISLCLRSGNERDVTKAILSSLDQSAKPLSPSQDNKEPSGGFLEARARFHEALLRPGGSSDNRRRRLREYQQAVESTFVEPVLKLAAEERDPKRRSQLAGLAGVNQMLHPAVELYLAKREKEVAKKGLRADGQDGAVRELLRMYETLFKFTKESR